MGQGGYDANIPELMKTGDGVLVAAPLLDAYAPAAQWASIFSGEAISPTEVK